MRNKFKVCFAKKGTLIMIACFLVLEVWFIFYTVKTGDTLRGSIIAIAIFLFGFILVLTSLSFCVNVNETTINVRTRHGRKYTFDCSEIDKITCYHTSGSKSGPIFYISIAVHSEKLDIGSSMAGFKEMAAYLLEKHENGEIKPKAISKKCKNTLGLYKEGKMHDKYNDIYGVKYKDDDYEGMD